MPKTMSREGKRLEADLARLTAEKARLEAKEVFWRGEKGIGGFPLKP